MFEAPPAKCDSFYLTLSSDSSRLFFPRNTIANFTTQLIRPICTSPRPYEVALCEVFLPTLEIWRHRNTASPIFLYCDITEPVLVSDTAARLLRVLTPDLIAGHHTFSSHFYMPVERRNFQTITISFHTKDGALYPFDDSKYPSTVVLHFRERPTL